jgi:hypothetical protein
MMVAHNGSFVDIDQGMEPDYRLGDPASYYDRVNLPKTSMPVSMAVSLQNKPSLIALGSSFLMGLFFFKRPSVAGDSLFPPF